MLPMLTMHATEFQPTGANELAASGTRLRPHTRWLAAAATAQRSAAALLLDEDSDPRGSVAPILDAWTALVLATWPEEHVPSDMRLLERAEALQLRQATLAIGAVRDMQARLAQVFAHHLREAGVVFNHQQVRAHRGSVVGWWRRFRQIPMVARRRLALLKPP